MPVGIEHVDGVVGDRLDQQAITAIIRLGIVESIGMFHCPRVYILVLSPNNKCAKG